MDNDQEVLHVISYVQLPARTLEGIIVLKFAAETVFCTGVTPKF
jgi:hypothetical protein